MDWSPQSAARASSRGYARTRYFAAALAALLLAATIGAAHAAGGEKRSAQRLKPLSSEAMTPARAAIARDRRARARRRAPKARAERKRSKTAYANTSRARSVALAKRAFGDVVGEPSWKGLRLKPDERVERYPHPNAAVVADTDGVTRSLVESMLPLLTRDVSGARVPVDLELIEHGDRYAPKAPLADLRIARAALGGVTLTGSDVTVRPESVDTDTRPTVVEDKVHHANVGRDTDLLIKPRPDGVEIYHLLRSVESPETTTLVVDVPAGAKLEARAGGAVVVRDDRPLVGIPAPVSWDADGVAVPTTLDVVGNELHVRTAHRGRDVHYPVLQDPVLVEDHRWWRDGYLYFGGWTEGASKSGIHRQTGWGDRPGPRLFYNGLHIWFSRDGWAGAPCCGDQHLIGDAGTWDYRAPGDSYVTRFEAAMGHHPDDTCAWMGIYGPNHPGGPNWESWIRIDCRGWGGESYLPVDDSWSYHDAEGPSGGNVAKFQFSLCCRDGQRWFPEGYLGRAQVFVRDDKLPTIDTSGLEDYAAGASPSGRYATWSDSESRRIELHANDSGLGVRKIDVTAPGPGTDVRDRNCNGTGGNRCPADYDLPEHGSPLTYNSGNIAEGGQIRVTAADPLDNSTAFTYAAKIDHSPPSIASRSGALWDSRAVGVTQGSHPLTVTAQDQYSGVKSREVLMKPGPIAEDGFTRTISNGWGVAERGGTWSLAGTAANFTVDGSVGRIVAPSNSPQLAALTNLSARDVDAKTAFRFPDSAPSSGNQYGYLVLRRQSDSSYYRIGIVRAPNNRVYALATNAAGTAVIAQVDTGLTYAPGDWIALRARASGASPTTVSLKVWKNGPLEPEPWLASATDASLGPQAAGAVGVRALTTSPESATIDTDGLVSVDLANFASANTSDNGCGSTGCPTSSTSTWNWVTYGYPEGRYEFKVTVRDPLVGQAGAPDRHTTTTDPWAVTFDKQPPTIETRNDGYDLRVDQGRWLRAEKYTVGIRPTESGSGVARIALHVDGTEVAGATAECVEDTCDKSYSLDYDAATLSDGTHTVKVTVTDKAGNVGEKSWAVRVDKTPPTLSATGSLKNAEGQQLTQSSYGLDASASDGGSGARDLVAVVDGQRQHSRRVDCPNGGCSLATNWTYLPENTARDSKGANHGTYAGGYTLDQAGATPDADRAVRLDGISGRVTTSFGAFAPGSPRTFAGWAKRNTSTTSDALFGGDASIGYPVLRARAGGNDVRFNPDTTGAAQDYVNALPGTGVWFHWALVWDGTARSATLYVNGQSKGTLVFGHGFGGAPGNVELGAEGGTTNPFDGHLDDVAVYSRALTADEVTRLYGHQSVEEGKVAQWRLDYSPRPRQVHVVAADQAGNTRMVAWKVSPETNPVEGCTTANSPATGASGGQTVGTATAATSLNAADPNALAPTQATTITTETAAAPATTVDPGVTPAGTNALEVDRALVEGSIGTNIRDGYSVGDGKSSVCLKPTAVSASATTSSVQSDAVLYANTAPSTDTVIRPTSVGSETITQIRDSTAPEANSWVVQLDRGEELRELPDGQVVIVRVGSSASSDEEASATSPHNLPDPWEVGDLTETFQDPALEETPPAVSAAVSTADAKEQLTQGLNVVAQAGSDVTDAEVVAAIALPTAHDEDGESVPTSIDVTGNTVTQTVEHRDAAYDYPVVARQSVDESPPGFRATGGAMLDMSWSVVTYYSGTRQAGGACSFDDAGFEMEPGQGFAMNGVMVDEGDCVWAIQWGGPSTQRLATEQTKVREEAPTQPDEGGISAAGSLPKGHGWIKSYWEDKVGIDVVWIRNNVEYRYGRGCIHNPAKMWRRGFAYYKKNFSHWHIEEIKTRKDKHCDQIYSSSYALFKNTFFYACRKDVHAHVKRNNIHVYMRPYRGKVYPIKMWLTGDICRKLLSPHKVGWIPPSTEVGT